MHIGCKHVFHINSPLLCRSTPTAPARAAPAVILYILPYHGYLEITRFLPLYAANPPMTDRVLYPLRTNSLAAAILAPPLSQ